MADREILKRDAEFWRARARALSLLAAADALAVVLPLPDGRYVSFAAHNLGRDPGWLDGPAQYLVWSAVQQRTVQRRSEMEIALSDGRTARSGLVAPIDWLGRSVGALVALREASDYDLAVGAHPGSLAELAGLELAVSNVLQQAANRSDDAELRRARDDRRHAIALYELTRLALSSAGAAGAAEIVADTLDYGLVGIWLEEDDQLRLADGHGYEGQPQPVPIDGDGALARVLREGTTQRVQRDSNGAGAWMGPASEVLAAPLVRGSARGVLVLGLPERPFTTADLTIAPTLAATVGLSQLPRALPAPAAPALSSGAPTVATARVTPPPADPTALPSHATAAPDPGSAAVQAPRDLPPEVPEERTRRGWVIPVFVLAAVGLALGAFLGEPLIFVLAGVMVLVALWGWLG